MDPESGGDDRSKNGGGAGVNRDIIEVYRVLAHPNGDIITRKMVKVMKIETMGLLGV